MKNGGGHFAPKLGGQFELESGGHFKLELGGQYHWNLQLWRLKKDCKLLLYPNEHHMLENYENQKDITQRTMTWFNNYLLDK
jgi:hypothetical protein